MIQSYCVSLMRNGLVDKIGDIKASWRGKKFIQWGFCTTSDITISDKFWLRTSKKYPSLKRNLFQGKSRKSHQSLRWSLTRPSLEISRTLITKQMKIVLVLEACVELRWFNSPNTVESPKNMFTIAISFSYALWYRFSCKENYYTMIFNSICATSAGDVINSFSAMS